MVKPRQVANNRFVVSVVAFADLHCRYLSQTDLQIPAECVLVQRLTARLHVALSCTHTHTLSAFYIHAFSTHFYPKRLNASHQLIFLADFQFKASFT